MIFGGLFAACGGSTASKNSSEIKLTYNKRYINEGCISATSDEQIYYMFKKDGTGIYNYYYQYEGLSLRTTSYVVQFRYLIIEDTVVCFFDAGEYKSDHVDGNMFGTNWSAVLGFSKDVLISTGGSLYICEDYLKNIPNFK